MVQHLNAILVIRDLDDTYNFPNTATAAVVRASA
jgi:hypothetical protein